MIFGNINQLDQDDQKALVAKQVSEHFVETCLLYLRSGKMNALREFLRLKLDFYTNSDVTQITILVMWTLNLILDQINIARHNSASDSVLEKWTHHYTDFLHDPKAIKCIREHKSIFYNLVGHFDDKKALVELYDINDDFEPMIREKLIGGQYDEAINLMKVVNNLDTINELLPIMMKYIPEATSEALKVISVFHGVQMIRLVPTMMSLIDKNLNPYIANFFQFCVSVLKFKEIALHNFLLCYYAEFNPSELDNYLKTQGTNLDTICYDIYFAIKICEEFNRLSAQIHLLRLLKQFEKAVDLAVQYDLDIAKEIANLPSNSDLLFKKKLWLNIAKYVIKEKNDVKQAMVIVKESGVLRIEDILPLFPDFVTIDKFKETLCSSLQDYNTDIENVKTEIKAISKSVEEATTDIQNFRHRFMIIKANDTCMICKSNIVSQPFYIFPCTHKFHTTCLLFEITPVLEATKKNNLIDFQRQLDYLNKQKNSDNLSVNSSNLSIREQIKSEIDNIIASECLYCGKAMLQKIRTPFFDEDKYQNILQDWL